MVREMNIENKDMKCEVDKIWEELGVKAEVKEVKKIGGVREDSKSMVLVRLKSLEDKKKIMEGKWRLGRKRERIEDDMTWMEKRAMWMIKREAARMRAGGKRVRVGYIKIWVNGQVWIWDEVEEKLVEKDNRNDGRREDISMDLDEAEVTVIEKNGFLAELGE